MASHSPAEAQAGALSAALEELEVALDALEPGGDLDRLSAALEAPVAALGAVAEKALG